MKLNLLSEMSVCTGAISAPIGFVAKKKKRKKIQEQETQNIIKFKNRNSNN